MAATPSRDELLGELGERIIDAFRTLQREVTVPRPGLISVTRSEADILRIVMEVPGTTVTEVARAFGQHKSNTSTRIAALVEKGLVQKSSGDTDGREVRVYPTDAAMRNLEAYRSIWAERLAPFATVDDETLAIAVGVFSDIVDGLTATRADED
jgi:DNA-binding MarR family transcriptional regulator